MPHAQEELERMRTILSMVSGEAALEGEEDGDEAGPEVVEGEAHYSSDLE